MSVSNGQVANQDTFNNAFMSKTQDSTTVAVITLNHTDSGAQVDDVQQDINDLKTDVATAQSDIAALEALNGSDDIPETQFTIVNGQGAAADVTGLVFDSASVKMAIVDYRIYRNTTGAGATNIVCRGEMTFLWNEETSLWVKHDGPIYGDDPLIDFTVDTDTGVGQAQYTSDSITGTADASLMVFKARTMG
jgi:hypothetical protein